MSATKAWTIAVLVSMGLAIANSAPFFFSLIRTPKGTVYLGTIHYWEDYFFYLNHFFQGAHGFWATQNRFTTEPLPSSFIYWNNILAGKIGGLLGMSPIISYNTTVIILAFFAPILVFYILLKIFRLPPVQALIGFLYANFSTSLPNIVTAKEGGKIIWPYQIWGTPNLSLDRLGTAPNHLERTIGFYLLFLFSFLPVPAAKKPKLYFFLTMCVIAASFATINPIQAISFALLFGGLRILIYILSKRPISRDELIRTACVVGVTLSFSFLTAQAMDVSPYKEAKVWEMANQSKTIVSFLLASIGPVLYFGIAGVLAHRKQMKEYHWFAFLFLGISYIVYMSPIPTKIGVSNLRVLFPALYVFWGAFAAIGFQATADWISKRLKINMLPAHIMVGVIILGMTIPTFWWELGWKKPDDVELNYAVVYLPTPIYEGFTALSTKTPYSDVTIANPKSRMNLLIPSLAGHTTYTGHPAATLNKDPKISQSIQFFTLQMTQTQALEFLNTNHIRYVFFTMFEGDRTVFGQTYPFLTKIFENTESAIYEVKSGK